MSIPRLTTSWMGLLLLSALMLLGACRHSVPPLAGWNIEAEGAPGAHWIREKGAPLEYPLPGGPAYADLIFHRGFMEGRALQKCYRLVLKRDPALYGELFILFEVAKDGRIVDPMVDFTTMAGPALEPCVLEVFRTLKLEPPPAAGMKVRYPLLFTSERTPPEIVDALVERHRLERWKDERKPRQKSRRNDGEKKDVIPW